LAGGGFPPNMPSPAFFQPHPGGVLPGNTVRLVVTRVSYLLFPRQRKFDSSPAQKTVLRRNKDLTGGDEMTTILALVVLAAAIVAIGIAITLGSKRDAGFPASRRGR